MLLYILYIFKNYFNISDLTELLWFNLSIQLLQQLIIYLQMQSLLITKAHHSNIIIKYRYG